MAVKLSARGERRATYTTLTGIFLSVFVGFTAVKNKKRKKFRLKPFDLLQLGLASYRLGRSISYDKVLETYRAPFTRTVPDPSGEGMTVVPRGTGVRAAIGELICCPICAGTWVAAALVYGLDFFPEMTRTFLAIMSSIGAAELFNAATEMMEWTGQLARELGGTERAVHQPDESKEHSPHDHHAARMPAFQPGEMPRRRFEDHSADWRNRPPQPQPQTQPKA